MEGRHICPRSLFGITFFHFLPSCFYALLFMLAFFLFSNVSLSLIFFFLFHPFLPLSCMLPCLWQCEALRNGFLTEETNEPLRQLSQMRRGWGWRWWTQKNFLLHYGQCVFLPSVPLFVWLLVTVRLSGLYGKIDDELEGGNKLGLVGLSGWAKLGQVTPTLSYVSEN